MWIEQKERELPEAEADAVAARLGALDSLAAELVGVAGVDLMQNRLKRAMLQEALTRTGGNLTRAAHLLGVRRQAVQQMVDRYDLKVWAREVRKADRAAPFDGELKAS